MKILILSVIQQIILVDGVGLRKSIPPDEQKDENGSRHHVPLHLIQENMGFIDDLFGVNGLVGSAVGEEAQKKLKAYEEQQKEKEKPSINTPKPLTKEEYDQYVPKRSAFDEWETDTEGSEIVKAELDKKRLESVTKKEHVPKRSAFNDLETDTKGSEIVKDELVSNQNKALHNKLESVPYQNSGPVPNNSTDPFEAWGKYQDKGIQKNIADVKSREEFIPGTVVAPAGVEVKDPSTVEKELAMNNYDMEDTTSDKWNPDNLTNLSDEELQQYIMNEDDWYMPEEENYDTMTHNWTNVTKVNDPSARTKKLRSDAAPGVYSYLHDESEWEDAGSDTDWRVIDSIPTHYEDWAHPPKPEVKTEEPEQETENPLPPAEARCFERFDPGIVVVGIEPLSVFTFVSLSEVCEPRRFFGEELIGNVFETEIECEMACEPELQVKRAPDLYTLEQSCKTAFDLLEENIGVTEFYWECGCNIELRSNLCRCDVSGLQSSSCINPFSHNEKFVPESVRCVINVDGSQAHIIETLIELEAKLPCIRKSVLSKQTLAYVNRISENVDDFPLLEHNKLTLNNGLPLWEATDLEKSLNDFFDYGETEVDDMKAHKIEHDRKLVLEELAKKEAEEDEKMEKALQLTVSEQETVDSMKLKSYYLLQKDGRVSVQSYIGQVKESLDIIYSDRKIEIDSTLDNLVTEETSFAAIEKIKARIQQEHGYIRDKIRDLTFEFTNEMYDTTHDFIRNLYWDIRKQTTVAARSVTEAEGLEEKVRITAQAVTKTKEQYDGMEDLIIEKLNGLIEQAKSTLDDNITERVQLLNKTDISTLKFKDRHLPKLTDLQKKRRNLLIKTNMDQMKDYNGRIVTNQMSRFDVEKKKYVDIEKAAIQLRFKRITKKVSENKKLPKSDQENTIEKLKLDLIDQLVELEQESDKIITDLQKQLQTSSTNIIDRIQDQLVGTATKISHCVKHYTGKSKIRQMMDEKMEGKLHTYVRIAGDSLHKIAKFIRGRVKRLIHTSSQKIQFEIDENSFKEMETFFTQHLGALASHVLSMENWKECLETRFYEQVARNVYCLPDIKKDDCPRASFLELREYDGVPKCDDDYFKYPAVLNLTEEERRIIDNFYEKEEEEQRKRFDLVEQDLNIAETKSNARLQEFEFRHTKHLESVEDDLSQARVMEEASLREHELLAKEKDTEDNTKRKISELKLGHEQQLSDEFQAFTEEEEKKLMDIQNGTEDQSYDAKEVNDAFHNAEDEFNSLKDKARMSMNEQFKVENKHGNLMDKAAEELAQKQLEEKFKSQQAMQYESTAVQENQEITEPSKMALIDEIEHNYEHLGGSLKLDSEIEGKKVNNIIDEVESRGMKKINDQTVEEKKKVPIRVHDSLEMRASHMAEIDREKSLTESKLNAIVQESKMKFEIESAGEKLKREDAFIKRNKIDLASVQEKIKNISDTDKIDTEMESFEKTNSRKVAETTELVRRSSKRLLDETVKSLDNSTTQLVDKIDLDLILEKMFQDGSEQKLTVKQKKAADQVIAGAVNKLFNRLNNDLKVNLLPKVVSEIDDARHNMKHLLEKEFRDFKYKIKMNDKISTDDKQELLHDVEFELEKSKSKLHSFVKTLENQRISFARELLKQKIEHSNREAEKIVVGAVIKHFDEIGNMQQQQITSNKAKRMINTMANDVAKEFNDEILQDLLTAIDNITSQSKEQRIKLRNIVTRMIEENEEEDLAWAQDGVTDIENHYNDNTMKEYMEGRNDLLIILPDGSELTDSEDIVEQMKTFRETFGKLPFYNHRKIIEQDEDDTKEICTIIARFKTTVQEKNGKIYFTFTRPKDTDENAAPIAKDNAQLKKVKIELEGLDIPREINPGHLESIDWAKTTVNELIDAINNDNLDRIETLSAPDITSVSIVGLDQSVRTNGWDETKELFESIIAERTPHLEIGEKRYQTLINKNVDKDIHEFAKVYVPYIDKEKPGRLEITLHNNKGEGKIQITEIELYHAIPKVKKNSVHENIKWALPVIDQYIDALKDNDMKTMNKIFAEEVVFDSIIGQDRSPKKEGWKEGDLTGVWSMIRMLASTNPVLIIKDTKFENVESPDGKSNVAKILIDYTHLDYPGRATFTVKQPLKVNDDTDDSIKIIGLDVKHALPALHNESATRDQIGWVDDLVTKFETAINSFKSGHMGQLLDEEIKFSSILGEERSVPYTDRVEVVKELKDFFQVKVTDFIETGRFYEKINQLNVKVYISYSTSEQKVGQMILKCIKKFGRDLISEIDIYHALPSTEIAETDDSVGFAKKTVDKYFASINDGKITDLAELLSPDIIIQTVSGINKVHTTTGWKEAQEIFTTLIAKEPHIEIKEEHFQKIYGNDGIEIFIVYYVHYTNKGKEGQLQFHIQKNNLDKKIYITKIDIMRALTRISNRNGVDESKVLWTANVINQYLNAMNNQDNQGFDDIFSSNISLQSIIGLEEEPLWTGKKQVTKVLSYWMSKQKPNVKVLNQNFELLEADSSKESARVHVSYSNHDHVGQIIFDVERDIRPQHHKVMITKIEIFHALPKKVNGTPTRNKKICHFPFIYLGELHGTCITKGNYGHLWCAVAVNDDLTVINLRTGWDMCDVNYLTDQAKMSGEDPPCEGQEATPNSDGNILGIKGQVCTFPFTYNKREHNECIKDHNAGHLWCATSKEYTGDKADGNWDYCRITEGEPKIPSIFSPHNLVRYGKGDETSDQSDTEKEKEFRERQMARKHLAVIGNMLKKFDKKPEVASGSVVLPQGDVELIHYTQDIINDFLDAMREGNLVALRDIVDEDNIVFKMLIGTKRYDDAIGWDSVKDNLLNVVLAGHNPELTIIQSQYELISKDNLNNESGVVHLQYTDHGHSGRLEIKIVYNPAQDYKKITEVDLYHDLHPAELRVAQNGGEWAMPIVEMYFTSLENNDIDGLDEIFATNASMTSIIATHRYPTIQNYSDIKPILKDWAKTKPKVDVKDTKIHHLNTDDKNVQIVTIYISYVALGFPGEVNMTIQRNAQDANIYPQIIDLDVKHAIPALDNEHGTREGVAWANILITKFMNALNSLSIDEMKLLLSDKVAFQSLMGNDKSELRSGKGFTIAKIRNYLSSQPNVNEKARKYEKIDENNVIVYIAFTADDQVGQMILTCESDDMESGLINEIQVIFALPEFTLLETSEKIKWAMPLIDEFWDIVNNQRVKDLDQILASNVEVESVIGNQRIPSVTNRDAFKGMMAAWFRKQKPSLKIIEKHFEQIYDDNGSEISAIIYVLYEMDGEIRGKQKFHVQKNDLTKQPLITKIEIFHDLPKKDIVLGIENEICKGKGIKMNCRLPLECVATKENPGIAKCKSIADDLLFPSNPFTAEGAVHSTYDSSQTERQCGPGYILCGDECRKGDSCVKRCPPLAIPLSSHLIFGDCATSQQSNGLELGDSCLLKCNENLQAWDTENNELADLEMKCEEEYIEGGSQLTVKNEANLHKFLCRFEPGTTEEVLGRIEASLMNIFRSDDIENQKLGPAILKTIFNEYSTYDQNDHSCTGGDMGVAILAKPAKCFDNNIAGGVPAAVALIKNIWDAEFTSNLSFADFFAYASVVAFKNAKDGTPYTKDAEIYIRFGRRDPVWSTLDCSPCEGVQTPKELKRQREQNRSRNFYPEDEDDFHPEGEDDFHPEGEDDYFNDTFGDDDDDDMFGFLQKDTEATKESQSANGPPVPAEDSVQSQDDSLFNSIPEHKFVKRSLLQIQKSEELSQNLGDRILDSRKRDSQPGCLGKLEGRMPDGFERDQMKMHDRFEKQMGFTPEETVALMAFHSLGGVTDPNNQGDWTRNPFHLDTEYLERILDADCFPSHINVENKEFVKSNCQSDRERNPELIMMSSDLVLRRDPYRDITEKFSHDIDELHRVMAQAWTKLLQFNFPNEEGDPLLLTDPKNPNHTELLHAAGFEEE